jgi:hypothetical protein
VLSGCPGDREALFKAIRKHENMRTSPTSVIGTVDEEFPDVLIYLWLGIGLDEALREKEAINETRTWV